MAAMPDTDTDSTSDALLTFGLADFLTVDERPTAIYALRRTDETTVTLSSKEPAHSNPAFDRLRESIAKSQVHKNPQYDTFLQWLSSDNSWNCLYAGRAWTAFTVKKKWRVATCNMAFEETEAGTSGRIDTVENVAGHTGLSPEIRHSVDDALQQDLAKAPAVASLDWTRYKVPNLSQYVRFIRDFDWKSTPLGPAELWSYELRQAVLIIMNDPEPRLILWGPDYTIIYNEACLSLIGKKHPLALGRPPDETFGELWNDMKPIVDKAALLGKVTRVAQFPLIIDRTGYAEETFWGFTMLPLLDRDGRPVGAVDHFLECTVDVVAERRMATVLKMGEHASEADSLSDVMDRITSVLNDSVEDIPFAVLYTVHESKLLVPFTRVLANVLPADWEIFLTKSCKLHNAVGFERDDDAVLEEFNLNEDSSWANKFRDAWTGRQVVDLDVEDGTLPDGFARGYKGRAGGVRCTKAVVIPIPPITGHDLIAFLVLGLSDRRPYDEEYHLFIKLLNDRLINSTAAIVLPKTLRKTQVAAEEAALRHSSLTRQLVIRSREAAESEAKFSRMAEAAPVGMYLFKADGTPISLNKKFFEYSNIEESAQLNFHAGLWLESVFEDDVERVDQQWQLLKMEKRPVTFEYRTRKTWKSYDKATKTAMEGPTWLLATAFPEVDSSGVVKTVMGWLTDISLQKWSEEIQAKRLDEALEAKKNANNFIDMTSHEMRNPLSAIVQSADGILIALGASNDGQDAKESPLTLSKDSMDAAIDNVTTIQLCASHQKRIVDDILTLSKLDSNLLKIAPDVVKPIELVHKVVKMYEAELHNAEIETEIIIDHKSFDELGIEEVVLDPSRLLQVLINLLTNSIKFTRGQDTRRIEIYLCVSKERPPSDEGGNVVFITQRSARPEPTFGTQWDGGPVVFLQFNIKDTGKGLTEEEMNTLFHRFSQASPKTYGQYGGSGLGLFISRELTEMQGGQIGVSSKAGKGSTFSFYLKAIKNTSPQKKQESSTPSNGVKGKPKRPSAPTDVQPSKDGSPLHVLVVEDNLINQKVMGQQLRRAGCTIHLADHGGEALTFLRRSEWFAASTEKVPLSIVLMDLEMPVMDGLTCIRKVREMQKNGELVGHLPVIAVTANARNEQIEDALGQGMDLVVTKPFRIPELVPQMRALIEGKRTANDGTFTSTVINVDPDQHQDFDPEVNQKDVDHLEGE